MTYNVGDRVSLMGDTGVVIANQEDDVVLVKFDDGTYGSYVSNELEVAE